MSGDIIPLNYDNKYYKINCEYVKESNVENDDYDLKIEASNNLIFKCNALKNIELFGECIFEDSLTIMDNVYCYDIKYYDPNNNNSELDAAYYSLRSKIEKFEEIRNEINNSGAYDLRLTLVNLDIEYNSELSINKIELNNIVKDLNQYNRTTYNNNNIRYCINSEYIQESSDIDESCNLIIESSNNNISMLCGSNNKILFNNNTLIYNTIILKNDISFNKIYINFNNNQFLDIYDYLDKIENILNI